MGQKSVIPTGFAAAGALESFACGTVTGWRPY